MRNEIIDKLCKYIDGVITIKEFAAWFLPKTYSITPTDVNAGRLVYCIKLIFAEYSNGHLTKDELRERLIDLIL